MEGQSFGQPEEETKEEVKKEKQETTETKFPPVNPRFKGIESADEPEIAEPPEIKEEIKKMDEEAQEKARDVAREKIWEARKHAKDFDPEKEAVLPGQKQKIEGQEIKERETEEAKSSEPESAKTREKEEAAEQKTEEPKQEIPAGKAEKQGGMEAERQRYERAREWNPIKKIMDRFDVRLRLDSRALKNKDREIKKLKAEVSQKQLDIQNFEKVVKETEKDFQWLIETGSKRGRDISGLQRELENSKSDYEQAKLEAGENLQNKEEELGDKIQESRGYEETFQETLKAVTSKFEKKIESNAKAIFGFKDQLKSADEILDKAKQESVELEGIISRMKGVIERKGGDESLKEIFKKEMKDYVSAVNGCRHIIEGITKEKSGLGEKIEKLEEQNDKWQREIRRKERKYGIKKGEEKRLEKEKAEKSEKAVGGAPEIADEQAAEGQIFEKKVKSVQTLRGLYLVLANSEEKSYKKLSKRIQKNIEVAEHMKKRPGFNFVKPRFLKQKVEELYAKQRK